MEISFTKLRLYRECPWRYYLRMVEGRRTPLTPAASLGLSLHRALECFHRQPEAADEELWRCYDSRWLAAGYPDQETRDRWHAKGRRILRRHLDEERQRRTVVVFVEREFLYPLGGHEVRGMIDRIDRHPDGRLELIDYKTSGDEGEMGPTHELQLRFYGLGCREALALRPDLLTLDFVAQSRRVSIPYDSTGEPELKSLIEEAARRIEAGEFPPDKSFCPRCDLRGSCRHYAGV